MDLASRQHIALKTINLLAGEKGEIPSELAIVPLPKMNKVSIVKYIEIPDKAARGNAWDASVTVLFDHNFLPYVHKYIDRFSEELDKLTQEIIEIEKRGNLDMELSTAISNFYFFFEHKIKSYLSTEDLEVLSPEDARLQMIKDIIEDFQNLIKYYIEHSEGFSQSDLKDALKLSYELSMLDINEVSSKKIRQIAKFAEKLRRKKENLAIKQRKIRVLSDKLDNGLSTILNKKLEEVTAVFDDYLENVKKSMERLSEKGSSILFFKKIYDDGETQAKILATSKELKTYLNFLKLINQLPHYEFVKLKKLYIKLEEMRELKKLREVGRTAQKMADILKLERKKVLYLTRDPRLKESLNDIFKISKDLKKVNIAKEENKLGISKSKKSEKKKKQKTTEKIKKSKNKKKSKTKKKNTSKNVDTKKNKLQ
ncbi:MAG: hypothetical protein ACTSO9_17460 [Candidatus Helarchaeota archaeon]